MKHSREKTCKRHVPYADKNTHTCCSPLVSCRCQKCARTHTLSHQHTVCHTKTRCHAAAGAEILFCSLQQKIPMRNKMTHSYTHGSIFISMVRAWKPPSCLKQYLFQLIPPYFSMLSDWRSRIAPLSVSDNNSGAFFSAQSQPALAVISLSGGSPRPKLLLHAPSECLQCLSTCQTS